MLELVRFAAVVLLCVYGISGKSNELSLLLKVHINDHIQNLNNKVSIQGVVALCSDCMAFPVDQGF